MKVSRNILVLLIGFFVVFADQSSKVMVRRYLHFGEIRNVLPGFFNLVHARNTGAVWGVFQQQTAWLAALSVLVLILMFFFRNRILENRLSFRVAAGLMVGGIIGNLIDRIKFGWVTDFLDFYYASSHWPAFNVADAAICAGVGVYLLFSFRSPSVESES